MAACAANTWVEFKEVQLEGKKRLEAAEFLRGNPLAPDARLDDARLTDAPPVDGPLH
jgi:hypothetical protein